jgi:hypothetical protein
MMQDASDRMVLPSDGVHAGPPRLKPLVKYLKCPVCRKVMDRANFAHTSGIVINICREDGIWFEQGQLAAVMEVAGIRSSGKMSHFGIGSLSAMEILKDPLKLLGLGPFASDCKEKDSATSLLPSSLASIEITGNSSLVVTTGETRRGKSGWPRFLEDQEDRF